MSKAIAANLILGLAILAGAAGLKWAEWNGLVSAEFTRTAVQVTLGLLVAVYANVIPKQVARRSSSPEAARQSQSALRFGGWALSLGGLIYAALWAFTPVAFADTASIVVLGAATAATVAYTIWAFAACRSTAGTSGA